MNNLKIIHWNCHSFKNKKMEFEKFLQDEQPDIVCMNEIKLSVEWVNHLLAFKGYVSLAKVREQNPNRGGGVAILVKENIDFIQVTTLDRHKCELVAISILIAGRPVLVAALYNPPSGRVHDGVLRGELFNHIDREWKDWVLLGDLNAKLTSLGCRENDDKGLEDILLNTSATVVSDKTHTYYRYGANNYSELLDLCICSPGMASKVSSFEVLTLKDMGSDHVPISVTFDSVTSRQRSTSTERETYNLQLADWQLFKDELQECPTTDVFSDIEGLNTFIINGILAAAEKSIPRRGKKAGPTSLPKSVLLLISARKEAKKRWLSSKVRVSWNDPRDYNLLFNEASGRVKRAIKQHKANVWKKFLDKVGKQHVSSRPFWQRINSFRSNKTARKVPSLLVDGKPVTEDSQKAEIFRSILTRRFGGETDERYDEKHRISVEEAMETELESAVPMEYASEEAATNLNFSRVTMMELEDHIAHLRARSSSGIDGISNMMLKNLSDSYKDLVLKLCNLSLREGRLPEEWKVSRVTMIPKKQPASDPNNYRPISLISCLSKLVERVVGHRLASFLEKNKLLLPQQSGFRKWRRTTDNLVFHSQKILESYRKKKKVLSLSFDIQAAFDAVWHKGLLFKLRKLGVPEYITRWTTRFLENRSFDVRVGDSISGRSPIVTGVPQGSSISPILFSVFINDIPSRSSRDDAYSLLFADDLTVFFIFGSTKIKDENVCFRVQTYLKEVEDWLCKWRMKMAPSKCNHTIFSQKNGNRNKFGLRFFNEPLPYEKCPVTLGVKFNESLSFEAQVKNTKAKCISRLNIIKILSHKSWKLDKSTLVSIYKALVGSVLDYTAFLSARLTDKLTKSMQAIQNRAMRSIFHRPRDESTDELCRLSGLTRVEERMKALNRSYFLNAFINKNELVTGMMRDYVSTFPDTDEGIKTLLCDWRDICLLTSPSVPVLGTVAVPGE
jgi:exonuclease III